MRREYRAYESILDSYSANEMVTIVDGTTRKIGMETKEKSTEDGVVCGRRFIVF